MENFSNSYVMRCLPNGKISRLSAEQLSRMVAECEQDVERISNIAQSVKRLNSMARTCFEAGYHYSARRLYSRAINIIIEYNESGEISLNVMRYRDLFYTAARGIDAAMRCVNPSWGNKAYYRAIHYFMFSYEDYNFSVLGIDNDESYNALRDFERRHNITYANMHDF